MRVHYKVLMYFIALCAFTAVLVFSNVVNLEAIIGPKALISDFGTFWSAANAFFVGVNPYDSAVFIQFKYSLVIGSTTSSAMIIPPWVLVFAFPFFHLDLFNAYLLWLFFSVFLLILTVIFTCRLFKKEGGCFFLGCSLVLVYPPVLQNLITGHFSILIAFLLALSFLFLVEGRLFLAGISLICISIKPHQYTSLMGALTCLALLDRNSRRILYGLCIGFACLVALSEVLYSGGVHFWLNRTGDVEVFTSMRTQTIVSEFRLLLRGFSGVLYEWPLYAFPIVGFVAGGLLVFIRGKNFKWQVDFIRLLCLGIIFSPYGWLYDASSLLPIVVLATISLSEDCLTKINKILISIFLFILFYPVLLYFPDSVQEHLESSYVLICWLLWEYMIRVRRM